MSLVSFLPEEIRRIYISSNRISEYPYVHIILIVEYATKLGQDMFSLRHTNKIEFKETKCGVGPPNSMGGDGRRGGSVLSLEEGKI